MKRWDIKSLKGKLIKVYIFAIIFGFFSVNSLAQQNQVLRLVVISEEDGTPLPGTNALIYNIDQNQEETDPLFYCVTDKDGFCEIRGLESQKEYILKVTFVGFKIFSETIKLEEEERRISRIVLKPEIGEINEVTVERQRYITTGEVAIRRISSDDVRRIPTPGVDGDLASYLQTVPGVISNGDRGGDLFIRGGTPDQNQTLVDNLQIIKPFHISNLFSAFPDEIIQSVDLYAGGFGAEYSGATSAVIDVNLRPGNMREYKANISASPYLGSFFFEGPIKKDKQSLLILGRQSTIDRFSKSIIGEDINIEFSDILARYSIQGDNITCNVTGIRTYDTGEIAPNRGINSTWKNTVLGTRCLGFDGLYNFPVEFTIGYTNYENKEGTKSANQRLSSVNKLYFNTDRKDEILGLKFNYGFGISFNNYKTILSERFTSIDSFERHITVVKVYTATEWEPTKKLKIQPGFATQIGSSNAGSFEPRLRISFRPDETNKKEISFAGGRYTQLLSGINDERDIGTVFTILKPVKIEETLPSAIHGIIGYQQRGDFFKFNIEGYVKKHKNISVSKWTPEAKTAIETALADGLTFGFDINTRFNKGALFTSISYGWSKVNYEATSGDLGAWIQESIFSYSPVHDQRHKLNIIASYDFLGISLNTSWEFGTGKPYTQIFGFDENVSGPAENPINDPGKTRILYSRPYGERLPYYHRLDVSLGRVFSTPNFWSLETEVGVINVYDRNNVFNFDLTTLQRVDQTPLLPYLSFKLQVN
ncbi:MAG: TonB-dependent receptor [Balneola sp.]